MNNPKLFEWRSALREAIAHNENLRSESEQNPKLEGKVVYLKPKKV